MTKIYMDVDIINDINGKLESHAGTIWVTLGKIRDVADSTSVSDGWWTEPAGESFARSVKIWADVFDLWLEKYNILKTRLKNEWDEWGSTDSSFDYDGEEIDTLAELWAWFSAGSKMDYGDGGSLFIKIDIKEIFGANGLWYWDYPPESTTIWRQDEYGRWYKVEITPSDWTFDLMISTKGVSLDFEYTFYSVEATWEMGNGLIGGAELSLGEVGVSGGSGGATARASLVSADLSVGTNIDGTYVGVKVGGKLGVGVGSKDGEIEGGLFSGGVKVGEEEEVAPPGTNP